MSVTEILDELPKLKAEERSLLFERLSELEAGDFEETPEMLKALDEAALSLKQKGGIPLEVVRARLEAKWPTP